MCKNHGKQKFLLLKSTKTAPFLLTLALKNTQMSKTTYFWTVSLLQLLSYFIFQLLFHDITVLIFSN